MQGILFPILNIVDDVVGARDKAECEKGIERRQDGGDVRKLKGEQEGRKDEGVLDPLLDADEFQPYFHETR